MELESSLQIIFCDTESSFPSRGKKILLMRKMTAWEISSRSNRCLFHWWSLFHISCSNVKRAWFHSAMSLENDLGWVSDSSSQKSSQSSMSLVHICEHENNFNLLARSPQRKMREEARSPQKSTTGCQRFTTLLHPNDFWRWGEDRRSKRVNYFLIYFFCNKDNKLHYRPFQMNKKYVSGRALPQNNCVLWTVHFTMHLSSSWIILIDQGSPWISGA